MKLHEAKELVVISPSRKLTQVPDRWPPEIKSQPPWAMPGWGITIWRGMLGKCPRCGNAPIFDGYLKVHDVCLSCASPFGQMPADDAPPYIAMLVVLHFVAFIVVLIFREHLTPNMFEYGLLLCLLVLACMAGLRVAKGAVIGILLKLGLKREALNV
jgi:uncharacterized protein (DUF983 family)